MKPLGEWGGGGCLRGSRYGHWLCSAIVMSWAGQQASTSSIRRWLAECWHSVTASTFVPEHAMFTDAHIFTTGHRLLAMCLLTYGYQVEWICRSIVDNWFHWRIQPSVGGGGVQVWRKDPSQGTPKTKTPRIRSYFSEAHIHFRKRRKNIRLATGQWVPQIFEKWPKLIFLDEEEKCAFLVYEIWFKSILDS